MKRLFVQWLIREIFHLFPKVECGLYSYLVFFPSSYSYPFKIRFSYHADDLFITKLLNNGRKKNNSTFRYSPFSLFIHILFTDPSSISVFFTFPNGSSNPKWNIYFLITPFYFQIRNTEKESEQANEIEKRERGDGHLYSDA